MLLGPAWNEMAHFADTPGYVKQQDDTRIKWFTVARRYEADYFQDMLVELYESPAYYDLQLSNRLGKDVKKFKKALAAMDSASRYAMDTLTDALASVSEKPTPDGVASLARRILMP